MSTTASKSMSLQTGALTCHKHTGGRKPLGNGKAKCLSIKLSTDMVDEIKRRADAETVTMSLWIRRELAKALAR